MADRENRRTDWYLGTCCQLDWRLFLGVQILRTRTQVCGARSSTHSHTQPAVRCFPILLLPLCRLHTVCYSADVQYWMKRRPLGIYITLQVREQQQLQDIMNNNNKIITILISVTGKIKCMASFHIIKEDTCNYIGCRNDNMLLYYINSVYIVFIELILNHIASGQHWKLKLVRIQINKLFNLFIELVNGHL